MNLTSDRCNITSDRCNIATNFACSCCNDFVTDGVPYSRTIYRNKIIRIYSLHRVARELFRIVVLNALHSDSHAGEQFSGKRKYLDV